MQKHTLPKLSYSYDDFEPCIDKETMEIHHTKHHQGYVDKLNGELEKLSTVPSSLEEIFHKIDTYSLSIRNNAGGHYNHTFFWESLIPKGSTLSAGPLMDAIAKKYQKLEFLMQKFMTKATMLFGSGWTWLVVDEIGEIEIFNTPNQDNPLMYNQANHKCYTPIFGLDLWEHAYYLQYQNRRTEYIDAIWHIVNWKSVAERYQKAIS